MQIYSFQEPGRLPLQLPHPPHPEGQPHTYRKADKTGLLQVYIETDTCIYITTSSTLKFLLLSHAGRCSCLYKKYAPDIRFCQLKKSNYEYLFVEKHLLCSVEKAHLFVLINVSCRPTKNEDI